MPAPLGYHPLRHTVRPACPAPPAEPFACAPAWSSTRTTAARAFARPGADPFVYLQGTNASFRRRCLVEVGGFDEEIEYYLDEVEVCMRVLDRGHVIRPLAGAAVHHKYLASHLRSPQKVILNP